MNSENVSFKDFVLEMIETIVVSLGILLLIFNFLASIEDVQGTSMVPNFHTNERILVERITKSFKPYNRGEVVVLYPPDASGKHYIKRVIGLPGDIIKIFNCDVYIFTNDQSYKLDEPYLTKGTCTDGGTMLAEGRSLKIPEGYYVVLGDNRDASVDSRSFGLLPKGNIIGRVIFRFWPLQKVGFIK